jgi:hypothetical protein
MQKSQSSELIKEGLLLGILSAVLYITSYTYAIGYATHYNIPVQLVSVDSNNLLQGALITSIGFAYYLSLFYNHNRRIKNDQEVTFHRVYRSSSVILLLSYIYLYHDIYKAKASNTQLAEGAFYTVPIFFICWLWFLWEKPLAVGKRIFYIWLKLKNIWLKCLNDIGQETDDVYNQKEIDRNCIIYRGQQKMTDLSTKSIYKESIFKLRMVDTPADILSSIIIAVYSVVLSAFIMGIIRGGKTIKYWILDTTSYEKGKTTLMKSGSKIRAGEEIQAVVAVYGDKIITAPVNIKQKQVHQKFTIHHMSANTQLTLYQQEIGPLEVVK